MCALSLVIVCTYISTVNKKIVVDEGIRRGHPSHALSRAAAIMVLRGELIEKNKGNFLTRAK
jgi:hypothetical protein